MYEFHSCVLDFIWIFKWTILTVLHREPQISIYFLKGYIIFPKKELWSPWKFTTHISCCKERNWLMTIAATLWVCPWVETTLSNIAPGSDWSLLFLLMYKCSCFFVQCRLPLMGHLHLRTPRLAWPKLSLNYAVVWDSSSPILLLPPLLYLHVIRRHSSCLPSNLHSSFPIKSLAYLILSWHYWGPDIGIVYLPTWMA